MNIYIFAFAGQLILPMKFCRNKSAGLTPGSKMIGTVIYRKNKPILWSRLMLYNPQDQSNLQPCFFELSTHLINYQLQSSNQKTFLLSIIYIIFLNVATSQCKFRHFMATMRTASFWQAILNIFPLQPQSCLRFPFRVVSGLFSVNTQRIFNGCWLEKKRNQWPQPLNHKSWWSWCVADTMIMILPLIFWCVFVWCASIFFFCLCLFSLSFATWQSWNRGLILLLLELWVYKKCGWDVKANADESLNILVRFII